MKAIQFILAILFFTTCNTKNDAIESTRLSHESKILLQADKLDEAQIVIDKSIKLDPTNYVAYNNRAVLKIKQNQPQEEILADLKKALDIKPNYEISLSTLTNYFHSIEDYDKTIQSANVYLDYAAKQNFDPKLKQNIYALRGESRYMKKDFDNAIKDCKTAIELDSTDAGSHKNLGDCYFYKNSVDAAIKEFTIAIKLDSNYYQPYLARARSYESKKISALLVLAEEDYQAAFKINPAVEDIYETNSALFKKIRQSNKE
jgi:tetratricopeptide (TPR) repeat protein